MSVEPSGDTVRSAEGVTGVVLVAEPLVAGVDAGVPVPLAVAPVVGAGVPAGVADPLGEVEADVSSERDALLVGLVDGVTDALGVGVAALEPLCEEDGEPEGVLTGVCVPLADELGVRSMLLVACALCVSLGVLGGVKDGVAAALALLVGAPLPVPPGVPLTDPVTLGEVGEAPALRLAEGDPVPLAVGEPLPVIDGEVEDVAAGVPTGVDAGELLRVPLRDASAVPLPLLVRWGDSGPFVWLAVGTGEYVCWVLGGGVRVASCVVHGEAVA